VTLCGTERRGRNFLLVFLRKRGGKKRKQRNAKMGGLGKKTPNEGEQRQPQGRGLKEKQKTPVSIPGEVPNGPKKKKKSADPSVRSRPSEKKMHKKGKGSPSGSSKKKRGVGEVCGRSKERSTRKTRKKEIGGPRSRKPAASCWSERLHE